VVADRARRRRLGALVAATLTAVLAVVLAPGANGQPCPLLEPDCVTTTSEPDSSTTTVDDEETTTTTDESDDETSTTEGSSTPREIVTTTTLTVSTNANLLVPGDGTEGAESTTTTIETVSSGSDGGISDDTLIMLMVGGLALVGLLVSVLTWRYWNATRPPPAPAPARARPRPRPSRPTYPDL
jgi:hypothetical protein